MTKNIKFSLFVAVIAMVLWIPTTTLAASVDEVTITIFHTNDMHGRFVNDGNSVIGMDTMAAIFQSRENSIFVDAGDTVHGLPFVNVEQGANAITLMNLANYSVMTPGNHEFNFGWQRLAELNNMANFPIIAANVSQNGNLLFDPYTIIEIAGLNIGFFGLATPSTPITTHPNNVIGVDFTDPIAAAHEAVALLQAAGVDIIVALVHLGINPDNASGYPFRIAAEVPGVDLIIDGHSHTLLTNGELANDIMLVQSGAFGAYLGVVEITFADGAVQDITASVIDRDTALANYDPDPAITAAIEQMTNELEYSFGEIIGFMPMTLYGDSVEHRETLRTTEVPIGNLVADALRTTVGSDLVLINSGGIRAHFYEGDITVGDVLDVLAFPNYVVIVEVTPAMLHEALENGVSLMPGNGRFPQISGFSFIFDQDAEEGSRVVDISINGNSLDLTDNTTTFTLSINDFMAAGGDGYTTFIGLEPVGHAGLLSEVFIEYLSGTTLDASRLVTENRIINLAVSPHPGIAVTPPEDMDFDMDFDIAITAPEDMDFDMDFDIAVTAPEDMDFEEVEEDAPAFVFEAEEVVVTAPPVAPIAGTGTIVNCWYLNIRADGTPAANVLGTVRVGTVITILETNSWNWHRVSINGIDGWVYGGFVQLN
ncbi:MAG: 5'-nucleotidase C-terminal domain-containing protein [Turicibacter sp.]|nr:5'-nucleotidase C-terminal domain-containing protein [Turicibacter sp.]